jgi:hypothetical protein
VYDMGKALMTIQRAFGLIPRIIGKGDQAKVRILPLSLGSALLTAFAVLTAAHRPPTPTPARTPTRLSFLYTTRKRHY